MTTGSASPTSTTTLDAWTLVKPAPSPSPGVQAYTAKDPQGREGWVRVIDRANCGPHGGAALLELLGRLERVQDARIAKLLAGGFAQLEGRDVLYLIFPAPDGLPAAALASDAMPAPEVLAILADAAEALTAAHGVGVAHGNISPDCLHVLGGRTLLVTEFGVASWLPGAPGPQRLVPAPELRAGGKATFAGDVFSLALSGAALALGVDRLNAWRQLDGGAEAADVMVALEQQGRIHPEAVRAIVGALHPDPLARPTLSALAQSLRPHMGTLPDISAPPTAADGPGRSAAIETWLRKATLPSGLPALNTSEDASEEMSLPPPPSAFLTEPTTEAAPEPIEEVPATPAPFPPQLPAPTLPPSPAMPPPAPAMTPLHVPAAGPVVVNLAAPRAPLPTGGEFPLVARWTERQAGKGATPVEILRPPAPKGTPNRPAWMILLAGAALGLGGGYLLSRPSVEVGSIHVVSTLADPPLDVEVEVDGRSLGNAPAVADGLTPGPHVVVLKAEGAEPKVIPLDLRPGANLKVADAPELFAARLIVTSGMKGATVALGDGDPESLPAEFEDLEPGSEVELTFRAGRDTIQRTVKLPVGELHFHFDGARGGGREVPSPRDATPGEAPRPRGAAPAPTPAPEPEDEDDEEAAATPPPPPPPPVEDTPTAKEAEAAGKRALLAGNFPEAERHTALALKLDGTLADAVKTMGIIMTRTNRACDGARFYRRYLELRPRAPDVDRVKSIIRDLEEKAQDCN